MIEQLVGRVFSTRNSAHVAHWRTQSYAQHMALGDLYDSLIDSVDAIVEAYQGAFNLIGPVEPALVAPTEIEAFIDHLEDESDWIEANREKISKRNTAVGNLVDALIEDYLKAIYKLRNLK